MNVVIGVDEVGWGALAGPLCAGAVAVPEDWTLSGLTDSKALSGTKRQQLLQRWRQQDWPCTVVFLGPQTLDDMTPTRALNHVLEAAARQVLTRCRDQGFSVRQVIFDGTRNFSLGVSSRAEPAADRTYPAVSMAAVLAKETRDLFMRVLAPLPLYRPFDFATNVGYRGSERHTDAIRELGPSPMHRRSYLKKLTR